MARGASYRDIVLADRPAGYWPLNDSGGSILDQSGRDLSGTVNGTLTRNVPGITAALPATRFDGTAAFVGLGAPAALDQISAWSLEAWVYPTGNVGGSGIISSQFNSNVQYELGFGPQDVSSTLGVGFYNGTWTTAVDPSGAIVGNVWYYIAGTWDSSNLILYKNGLQIATTGSGQVPGHDSPFWIGKRHDSTQFFPGTIQHVAVYARTLTAPQILAHYRARTLTPTRPVVGRNIAAAASATSLRSLLGVGT